MNKIQELFESKATNAYPFKPNLKFFKEIGIGRKRFWQMMENKIQPNLDELNRLAKYLGIDAIKLTNF